MYIVVHFGDVCNMTCSYCANEDRRRNNNVYMSSQIMQATTEFVNKFKNAVVTLQGGDITVYPYALDFIVGLKCAKIELLTNGLLSNKLAEFITSCKKEMRFYVNVTVHHDYWITHKQTYINALLADYYFLRKQCNVTFTFKLLVDPLNIETTVDICNWLTANIDEKNIDVYHVRRYDTKEEFIKTCIISKRLLPAYMYKNLFDHGQLIVIGNPFYGKSCKQFTNYMLIRHDGSIWSSFCTQAMCADSFVTDVLFYPCGTEVMCEQKFVSCPETCLRCNGFNGISEFLN